MKTHLLLSKLDFLAEGSAGMPPSTALTKFPAPGKVSRVPVDIPQQGSTSDLNEKLLAEAASPFIPEDQPDETPSEVIAAPGESYQIIRIDHIDEPKVPQRWHYDVLVVQDLARNILTVGKGNAMTGLIQPILVRVDPLRPERFSIIEGLSRVKAFRDYLHEPLIKAIVRTDLNEVEGFFVGYDANEDRTALSDYDKGMAFNKLIHEGIASVEVIMNHAKLSKQEVSALLSFAKLPASVHEVIERNKERFGSAAASRLAAYFGKTSDEDKVVKLAEKVASGSMSYKKLSSFVAAAETDQSIPRRPTKFSRPISSFGQIKYGGGKIELLLEGLLEDQESPLADAIEKAINAVVNEYNNSRKNDSQ